MPLRKRKWDDSADDDPGAGLVNLFDVWIAFAAALLLAMISYFSLSAPASAVKSSSPAEAGGLEVIEPARMKKERFRPSRDNAGGEGERLGTAYRLKSGEVIYVPDPSSPKP